MQYAALCCIAKDEDAFLKEWLAYHSLIGFEHFFVYDNASGRPIADLLGGFAEPEQLTVLRSSEERSQHFVYTHCLTTFGRSFKWIAFLDVDEFIRIAPVRGRFSDIRDLLADYEPYAGLGLNWRMFSSSGHEQRPDGLVIENYTHYYRDDVHIKSLVQPDKIRDYANPHCFFPKPGQHIVSATHFLIPGGFPACVPVTKEVCVNHYYFKSRQCFQFKIARGSPGGNIVRTMEEFDRHLTLPVKSDTSLVPFASRLHEALAADHLPLPEAPQCKPPENVRVINAGGDVEAAKDSSDAPFRGAVSAGEAWSAKALLAAAQDHFAKDRLFQAALCLCYAVLPEAPEENSSISENGEDLTKLAIWSLRAAIARKCKNYARAEYCLRRAFECGACIQAHSELAGVMLNTGRVEESKYLVELIRTFDKW